MEEDMIMAKLRAMKISNWESIPYSEDLHCPNDDDGSYFNNNRIFIGWCDTPNGLMQVYECPFCYNKYRYHGVLQERWDLEQFLGSICRDIVINNKLGRKIYEKVHRN